MYVSESLVVIDESWSAHFQSEEEFLVLDAFNEFIEDLDVLAESISDDLGEVVGLLTLQLITQQLHTAHDEGFLLVAEFHVVLLSWVVIFVVERR
jgi:hypothetical protein